MFQTDRSHFRKLRAYLSNALAFVFFLSFAQFEAMPIDLNFEGRPKIKLSEDSYQVETNQSAGGKVFLLKKPIVLDSQKDQIQWRWKIGEFPKIDHKKIHQKDHDDYAIRVGVLIDHGGNRMRLTRSMSRTLRLKNLRLTHVIFYPAVPKGTSQKCVISRYHPSILNCPKIASSAFRRVKSQPISDFKAFVGPQKEKRTIKVIGFWIFSDSDNSQSSSQAELRSLKINIQ